MDPGHDAAFFRALLKTEGPGGVADKMYVGADALAQPLMVGISTATREWLEIYEQMRRGMSELNALGVVEQLDEALAAGLAHDAEAVLATARRHPEIPLADVCYTATTPWADSVAVLDGPELLGVVRRQTAIDRVSDPTLRNQRAVCLDRARALLRRQWRVYLVSYGASDAKAAPTPFKNDSDRRELEAALATARADPTLRARADGSLPDGPFRVDQIPREVLKHCIGGDWGIANPEGPWAFSDVYDESQEDVPRVRLLGACKISERVWDIACEHGGLTTSVTHVRVMRTAAGWNATQVAPRSHPRKTSADAYWPDCRALPAQ